MRFVVKYSKSIENLFHQKKLLLILFKNAHMTLWVMNDDELNETVTIVAKASVAFYHNGAIDVNALAK